MMNFVWNKANAFNYKVCIGNYMFNINTHKENFRVPTHKEVEFDNNIPILNITIWIDENEEYIEKIKQNIDIGEEYLPESIIKSYNYLNLDSNKMKNRINKYVILNDVIYVHFRFPCEDFFLIYSLNSTEIFIVGNEIYLERIIIDFISLTSKTLPLHAGCFTFKDTCFLLLGTSNSGKTGVVLKMLKKGASYISDDIVYYKDGNAIRCCDYISIRKEYIDSELSDKVCFEKANKCYLYINDIEEKLKFNIKDKSKISQIILISPMKNENLLPTELFPIFARDSMWCMDIVGKQLPSIENIIYSSTQYYNELLKKSNVKVMNINYLDYEKSVYEYFENMN